MADDKDPLGLLKKRNDVTTNQEDPLGLLGPVKKKDGTLDSGTVSSQAGGSTATTSPDLIGTLGTEESAERIKKLFGLKKTNHDLYNEDPYIVAARERAKKDKDEREWADQAGERNSFGRDLELKIASGVDMFGRMVSSIPASLVDLALKSQPQLAVNIDAEILGKAVEKSTGLSEEYNPLSPNNALATMFQKRALENQKLAGRGYQGGITKALETGNYVDAGKLAAMGIAESLPIMFALIASRGAGLGEASSLIGLGLGTTSTTYEDLKKEYPEFDRNVLYTNAILTGLGEAGSELVGTSMLYNQGRKLFMSGAKDEAKEVVTKGVGSYLDKAFKKAFVGSSMLADMSGEVSNQIWKNATDKWSGIDPERDYLDGVGDAAIISLGTTGLMASAIKGSASVMKPSTKKVVATNMETIATMNEQLINPEILPDSRDVILSKVGELTEQTNNHIDSDAQSYDSLTDEQKDTFLDIADQRTKLETVLSDPTLTPDNKVSVESDIAKLDIKLEDVKPVEAPIVTADNIDSLIVDADTKVENIQSLDIPVGDAIGKAQQIDELQAAVDQRTDLQKQAESIAETGTFAPVGLVVDPVAENELASEDNTAVSDQVTEDVKEVTWKSPELGNITLRPAADGSFEATYEDGDTRVLSAQDAKELMDVPGNLFELNEEDINLARAQEAEELSNMYVAEMRNQLDTGSVESAIADYGPTITQNDWKQNDDVNTISPAIARSYFKRGAKASENDFDAMIDEMNDIYFNGEPVIQMQDVLDFMKKYEGGVDTFYMPSGNPALKRIADRYKEVTGKGIRIDHAEKQAKRFNTTAEVVANLSITTANERNIESVERYVDRLENETDLHGNKLYSNLDEEFNAYVADPANEFNLFYEIFGGEIPSQEESALTLDLINGKQTGNTEIETESSAEAVGVSSGTQTEVTEQESVRQSSSESIADQIDYIFSINSNLSKVGSKEDYQKYIETIFPGSVVKEVVYRAGDVYENRQPIYFASSLDYAEFVTQKKAKPYIINITNPYSTDNPIYDADANDRVNAKFNLPPSDVVFMGMTRDQLTNPNDFLNNQETDGIIGKDGGQTDGQTFVVFNPLQTYALGTEMDVNKFGKFIENSRDVTPVVDSVLTKGSSVSFIDQLGESETGVIVSDGPNSDGSYSVRKSNGVINKIDQSRFNNQPVPVEELDPWEIDSMAEAQREFDLAKDAWVTNVSNLSIASDPKRSAELDVKLFKATVKLALEYIKQGVKTVADFAKAIGRTVDDQLTSAWDTAMEASISDRMDEVLAAAVDKITAQPRATIGIVEKPVKGENESMGSFADRLLRWKKLQDIAAPALKPKGMPKKQMAAGLTLLRGNMNMPVAEFNEKMGLLGSDYSAYVETLKNIMRNSPASKASVNKIMNQFRDMNPKKVTMTEMALLKKQYRDMESGNTAGISAGRAQERTRIKELKAEVLEILKAAVKSKAFAGIDFSDRQLFGLANKVNRILTNKSFDTFTKYMDQIFADAEYIGKLNKAEDLAKSLKKLSKSDTITNNDVEIMKSLAGLNPLEVTDLDLHLDIMQNVNNSRTAKDVRNPNYDDNFILSYVAEQNAAALRQDSRDNMYSLAEVMASESFLTPENPNLTIDPVTIQDLNARQDAIVNDSNKSVVEKKAELRKIGQAIKVFERTINKNATGDATVTVNFDQIVTDLDSEEESEAGSDTVRDQLQDINEGLQDIIDLDDPTLFGVQKEDLTVLKEVDLTDLDTKTQRLFNNVLGNVMDNDNSNGVGVFRVIREAQGENGAGGFLQYLLDAEKKIRDKSYRSTVGQARQKTQSVTSILWRLANNDKTLFTKLDTLTQLDRIRGGSETVERMADELINQPLTKLFKENPELSQDAYAMTRLALFSYVNQYKTLSSAQERDATVRQRIARIREDINLKTKEGDRKDVVEGEIEDEIYTDLQQAILTKSGKDIFDPEQLATIGYEDVQDLDFLTDAERQAYDIFRAADDQLKPTHERITNELLNKTYESWENHMKDSYRLLETSFLPASMGSDTEMGMASMQLDEGIDQSSGASMERTKGNPLKNEAGKQRVINLNFWSAQRTGIKDMLHDMHTLEPRMVADQVFRNKDVKRAIGNDNHSLLKGTVTNFAVNSMGKGAGFGNPTERMFNQGINFLSRVGAARQLWSVMQYVKQMVSAATNVQSDLTLSGHPKLLWNSLQIAKDLGDKGFFKGTGVNQRGKNMAGLNITANEALADVDQRLKKSKEKPMIIAATKKALSNAGKKMFGGINADGTEDRPAMSWFIEAGDVTPARWSWVAYYAQSLIDQGKVGSFEDINWENEIANRDRVATSYAEGKTSRQLNENTTAGRAELFNSKNAGMNALKNMFLPFGSFNLNKGNVLVENLNTILDKRTYASPDYRKNEAREAAQSILSSLAEESIFQGIKIGLIGTGMVPLIKMGAIYAISAMTPDDDEKEMDVMIEMVKSGDQKRRDSAWHEFATNVAGNYFLGMYGTVPQEAATSIVNAVSGKDVFLKRKFNIQQQLENAENLGMIGAAGGGMVNIFTKDIPRSLWKNTSKHGETIERTQFEKSVVILSAVSNVAALTGRNDADFNRALEGMKRNVTRGWGAKYGDPMYIDLNNMNSRVKIFGRNARLSDEQNDVYERKKAEMKNRLNKNIPEKVRNKIASDAAKAHLHTIYKPKDFEYVK